MSDIYEQHDKAFGDVSAYVVMKGADRVATVAFKYPRDGAGRLWAYVHWIGVPMVRGYASGGGYDKHSAACSVAARKIEKAKGPEIVPNDHHDIIAERHRIRKEQESREAFIAAMIADDGLYWNGRLRNAGFEVWQAV
jgi:hypothetical protein